MINYISIVSEEPFHLCIIHLYFFFGEILTQILLSF